jgi:hypothetical protein
LEVPGNLPDGATLHRSLILRRQSQQVLDLHIENPNDHHIENKPTANINHKTSRLQKKSGYRYKICTSIFKFTAEMGQMNNLLLNSNARELVLMHFPYKE